MPPDSLPGTVIMPDIENYGAGGYRRHLRLQHGLHSVFEAACDESRVWRPEWHRQPSGDGELALIPASVPKARIVDLIRELEIALNEYNADKVPTHRIRLRLAVDHGDVVVSSGDLAGDAPITVARLCSAPALRRALAASPAASLAVIVSGRFYDDVIQFGPRGIDPAAFQRVLVIGKSFKEPAWIYVPAVDRPPVEAVPAVHDDPGQPGGSARLGVGCQPQPTKPTGSPTTSPPGPTGPPSVAGDNRPG
jgi:hypothetical protein